MLNKISRIHEQNEKEKKKAYDDRIIQIEQGSFTPLAASWIKRKINFYLMRSIGVCLRGSRSTFH